jgi:hypothetical protein
MPTLHSHTHCQVAQAAPKPKPGKECVCPTARQSDKWMEKRSTRRQLAFGKKAGSEYPSHEPHIAPFPQFYPLVSFRRFPERR